MSWDKNLKIKQIDDIISHLRSEKKFQRPKSGWLKLIRTALGMSARALGERVKLTQSRIALIEKGEVDGSITLNTLEKISNGLDCDVVYFLIPKTGSLENTRKKQAYKKASKLDKHAEKHMSLEDQATSENFRNENIDKLASHYLEKWPTDFWNDK